MMSQASSQVHDPDWVSIPVSKFSHNTSPYGTRSFTWNHVGQRNDLDCIIRNARVVDESGIYTIRVVMKITAGIDVLESQDLGELVKFAQELDPSSRADLPVQVVIRNPCIAMRYPKSTNTVRRIQLRFRNGPDFTKALNIFKDLGLPITETTISTTSKSRPSLSPAPSLFSPASSFSTEQPGPLSLTEDSLRLTDGSFNPARNSSPESGFKIPMRPETASSGAQRPSSAQTFVTAPTHRTKTPPTTFSPHVSSSFITASDSIHEATKLMPSFYVSQLERESQSRRLSYPVMQTSSHGDHTTFPLFVSQLQSQRKTGLETNDEPHHPLTASPFFSKQGSTVSLEPLLASMARPTKSSMHTSTLLDHQRPASSPLDLTNNHSLWLPPKRELPFPKSKENTKARSSSATELGNSPNKSGSPLACSNCAIAKAGCDNNVPCSRCVDKNLPCVSRFAPSASKVTPQLPKPTPVTEINPAQSFEHKKDSTSTPIPKTAKKRVAQRKSTITKAPDEELPAVEAPMIEGSKDGATDGAANGQEDEPSPLAAKSAAVRPSSASSGLQSKAIATKKRTAAAPRPSSAAKKQKMVDQSTQTQTLSGRDHTTAMKLLPVNATPPHIVADVSPNPPDNYLDTIDAFITKYKARPAPREIWEVPRYAEVDEEQRQLIVNDFICANLENTDFLRLCEDTEKAWRRIGLGM